jgi:hypothetical protein
MRNALAFAFFFTWFPALADAQVALPMWQVGADGSIQVDGALREWRGVRFIDVGEGADASMRIGFAYDATGLYVAAEVRDDRLIRTRAPAMDEDAIVLTLALPARRGLSATEIWLWAGQSGQSAAAIGIGPLGRRPSQVSHGQIVEAPARGGYTLEAFVPWSAIPSSTRWQEGRGTVRLRDVDQAAHPEIEAEPTFASLDPAHLDRLPQLAPSGGEAAAFESFLASRNLQGMRPTHDLRGDVGGVDERPERVSIVDRFVVVTGPGWQEGRGFSFVGLAVAAAADIREPRLVDLTGDGKRELIVTLRQQIAGGSREIWQVHSFSNSQVQAVFAIETRRTTAAGFVEAGVNVRTERRAPVPIIEVRTGRAEGLDAQTFELAPASDAESILVPWGPVLARTYRWNGSSFAQNEERPNPRYVAASSAAPAPSPSASAASVPSQPPPPGIEELLVAFRRERGIAERTRPTFRMRANVSGSDEPEELVIYGRDLVVVGTAFRGGTGWFHFELPARTSADVLDVRTAEITSDARHEILVRIGQTIGDVRREVLLAYQFTPVGFPVLLEREVTRVQGERRIENEVRIERGALQIHPGRARGWEASNWPFAEGPSSDGVAPLLLPWRDAPSIYRFSGGRLVAR